MKTIKINRIVVENWRGKNLDVSFNEGATKISAKNEVGKTTLINAWNWVFTSYTSPTSNKNEELFDNRKPLTYETPIAKVCLCIDIDGKEHTIERTAKAKFSRPSGSIEYVKANTDEYTIKVDGFTIATKEFTQWVNDHICDYALLPFLLDGSFFTTLAEDDRVKARKALGNVVGEVTNDDFMGDYTLINSMLSCASAEQIIASSNEEKRKLETELTKTTALLESERTRQSAYNENEVKAVEEELESVKTQIADINNCLATRIKDADTIDTLTKRLVEVTQEYTMASSEYEREYNDKLCELRQAYNAEKSRVQALTFERKHQERRIALAEENICKLEKELVTLEKTYKEVSENSHSVREKVGNADVCPLCGTPLSSVLATSETLLSDIYRTKKEIQKCHDYINENSANLPNIEDNTVDMLAEIEKHEKSYVPFAQTVYGVALDSVIKGLRSDLDKFEVKDNSALLATRESLANRREELVLKKASYGVSDDQNSRVMALEDSRRAIANNIVHLEGVIAKAKEYIEERAQIISERINSRLNGYKVVMYSTQKDGTKVPDCVITDNSGVKFATLSNSARIRANLQMQELFCSAMGVSMPIWVDECSIFDDEHLPKPNGQTIYLYAGNSDNLVVE